MTVEKERKGRVFTQHYLLYRLLYQYGSHIKAENQIKTHNVCIVSKHSDIFHIVLPANYTMSAIPS